MGIVSTGNFAKDLWPGVNAWYGMKYMEYPVEHIEVFDVKPSTLAFEEEVGMTGFGLAPIKQEGGPITYEETEQAFIDRYVHIVYGLGFIITREMYEDGIAGTVALRRAEALAFSIRQTIETIGANVLNNAFDSNFVFGDGVELCSLLHPNASGGTWQNELTTAADLSEAALEQACIDIAAFTSDKGLQIAVRPQKLIVPTDTMFEAERVLKSELRPAGASQTWAGANDLNALKSMGAIPQGYVVNHYLVVGDGAWFIKTDCPLGMTCFERRAEEFDTDNDFDTENARFKATFRKSFGCTDKRGIYGCPGAP